ncbi:uncharacterized protein FIBRA_08647 [Fibroporia radiculosa]|uniref:Uncharacterized protein n=1 Tax=Fibroporia radiculosa TaxID=599839 RepID=J4GHZ6_9APHY|nr:uncharacterized protein FIBRA_08647 [Fibroporia radiculosa]CCM06388.1 predicted protein [Fibroporia radiculosa]
MVVSDPTEARRTDVEAHETGSPASTLHVWRGIFAEERLADFSSLAEAQCSHTPPRGPQLVRLPTSHDAKFDAGGSGAFAAMGLSAPHAYQLHIYPHPTHQYACATIAAHWLSVISPRAVALLRRGDSASPRSMHHPGLDSRDQLPLGRRHVQSRVTTSSETGNGSMLLRASTRAPIHLEAKMATTRANAYVTQSQHELVVEAI